MKLVEVVPPEIKRKVIEQDLRHRTLAFFSKHRQYREHVRIVLSRTCIHRACGCEFARIIEESQCHSPDCLYSLHVMPIFRAVYPVKGCV